MALLEYLTFVNNHHQHQLTLNFENVEDSYSSLSNDTLRDSSSKTTMKQSTKFRLLINSSSDSFTLHAHKNIFVEMDDIAR